MFKINIFLNNSAKHYLMWVDGYFQVNIVEIDRRSL